MHQQRIFQFDAFIQSDLQVKDIGSCSANIKIHLFNMCEEIRLNKCASGTVYSKWSQTCSGFQKGDARCYISNRYVTLFAIRNDSSAVDVCRLRSDS